MFLKISPVPIVFYENVIWDDFFGVSLEKAFFAEPDILFAGDFTSQAARSQVRLINGKKWSDIIAAKNDHIHFPSISDSWLHLRVSAVAVKEVGRSPGPRKRRSSVSKSRRSSKSSKAKQVLTHNSALNFTNNNMDDFSVVTSSSNTKPSITRGRSVSDADVGEAVARRLRRDNLSTNVVGDDDDPSSARPRPRRSVSLVNALSDDFFFEYVRQQATRAVSWARLPEPALLSIMEHAGGALVAATDLASVCRHWNRVSQNAQLWRRLLNTDYRSLDRHGHLKKERGLLLLVPGTHSSPLRPRSHSRGAVRRENLFFPSVPSVDDGLPGPSRRRSFSDCDIRTGHSPPTLWQSIESTGLRQSQPSMAAALQRTTPQSPVPSSTSACGAADDQSPVGPYQLVKRRHQRVMAVRKLTDAWLDSDRRPPQKIPVTGAKHTDLVTVVHLKDSICVSACRQFICVYDLRSGSECRCVRSYAVPEAPIHDLACLPRESGFLAGSDMNGRIYLWHPGAGEQSDHHRLETTSRSPMASPPTTPLVSRRRTDSGSSATSDASGRLVRAASDLATQPFIELADVNCRRLFMSREGSRTLLFAFQNVQVPPSHYQGTAPFFAPSASSSTTMGTLAQTVVPQPVAFQPSSSPFQRLHCRPPAPPPLDCVKLFRLDEDTFDGPGKQGPVPSSVYRYCGRVLCVRRTPRCDFGMVCGHDNAVVNLWNLERGVVVDRLVHRSEHPTASPSDVFESPASALEWDCYGRLLVGGATDLAAYDWRLTARKELASTGIVGQLVSVNENPLGAAIGHNGLVLDGIEMLRRKASGLPPVPRGAWVPNELLKCQLSARLRETWSTPVAGIFRYGGERSISHVATSGALAVCASATSKKLQVFDLRKPGFAMHTFVSGGPVHGLRLVAGGRVAVVSSYGFGGLSAFDLASGRPLFHVRDEFMVSAAADNGSVCVSLAGTSGPNSFQCFQFGGAVNELTAGQGQNKKPCIIS